MVNYIPRIEEEFPSKSQYFHDHCTPFCPLPDKYVQLETEDIANIRNSLKKNRQHFVLKYPASHIKLNVGLN